MSTVTYKSSPFNSQAKASALTQRVFQGSLDVYTGSWTATQAAHLVRRTHFGNKINDVNRARTFPDATTAAETLVDEAISTPLPDDPSWFKQGASGDINDFYDIQWNWMDSMYNGGLLEKMMLFWTNHFVVGYQGVAGKAGNSYANHMQNYMKLLHVSAFGNFKDLVYNMSVNPAMLYYLNGYVNDRSAPNEDFARELLELFTLGILDRNGSPNYSDQQDPPGDVQEVARACTGWRVNNNNFTSFLDNNAFDSTNKTIFGGSAQNYTLQMVVDRIFDEKPDEVAWFICKKLYTFFVSAIPNNSVIAEMATYFVQQNFDLAALMKRLLSSQHFYEEEFIGSRIKSPVELYVGLLRELEVPPNTSMLEFLRVNMPEINQELLNPPNVAGWPGYNPPGSDDIPGHYAWLNTSVLPTRWNQLQDIIDGNGGVEWASIRIAEKISNPSNPFELAIDLAEHMLSMPLSQVGVRTVDDDFAGGAVPVPDSVLSRPEHEQNLMKIMLDGTPWYDWTAGVDNGDLFYPNSIDKLLKNYIAYLFQLPAYQLT
ncbi:MAG: DUF1800 family protein [Bacteroidota bacterium]